MKKIALLCATTAFVLPGMAMAQSTGSVDFEDETNVVVTGTRSSDVAGVADSRHLQDARSADLRVHPAPDAGPVDQRDDQQPAGRQLHQQRSVRLGRRHPLHPRLRQQPHLRDVRRHPAERHRQLRALLEPAARPRDHRAGQRQPRLDRRRQPDRLGDRLDRQLPHPPARSRRSASACRARYGDFDGGDFHRIFGVDRHRRVHPLGHARLRLGQHGDQRFRLRPPRHHLQAAV